jgi:hypothetical protein
MESFNQGSGRKPIKGLNETILTKMYNVSAFAMDSQFCRRDVDVGVKKDIWSVMEDFSKTPGGKDLNKMKAQYEMIIDAVVSKHVTV